MAVQSRGIPIKTWRTLQLVMISKQVSDRALAVFARLLEHRNHRTGRCYPSEATIAQALNCSVRTVRNAIRELEKIGVVETFRNRGPNGTNLYLLRFFEGGNEEYREAEGEILSRRKKPAAKPYIEPSKKPKPGWKPLSGEGPSAKKDAVASLTLKVEELQNALVDKLGSDANAWEAIMALSEEDLESAAKNIRDGKIWLGGEVERLLAQMKGGSSNAS